MHLTRAVESLSDADRGECGGKAVALGSLVRAGFLVPPATVLPARVYRDFVDGTGLRGRILLELDRKTRDAMRWEEMWDASLRIRHAFVTTPWPPALRADLATAIARFDGIPVAVRSSAPEEDTGRASFAGVHASFVNVVGAEAILDCIKQVWASLFSDAALLYAHEVGVDVLRSSMAVVVQQMIHGDCSGVTFTRSPTDDALGVVEAVHGLNQGLVDGTVQPDRWTIERASGQTLRHEPAERRQYITATSEGVSLEPLPGALGERAPLEEADLARVWALAAQAERLFGAPQDLEWTLRQEELFVLQARPITTLRPKDLDDGRAWYLSLHRSQETLEQLRIRIEDEILPAMRRDAETLARLDLRALSDDELDREVSRRSELYRRWHDVYWDELIPFAHGVRLFGELYNITVRPEDPYEFVRLLEGASILGVERNRRLQSLADRLARWDGPDASSDDQVRGELDRILEQYGGIFAPSEEHRAGMLGLLRRMRMEDSPDPVPRSDRPERLEQGYLEQFSGEEQERARGLLELARVSYRLRDDDNIYLGRIESQWRAGEAESRRRGRATPSAATETETGGELVGTASSLVAGPARVQAGEDQDLLRPRQIVGQPAGPGVSRGIARVIHRREDLFAFERGEVLVTDAVDPNMTFVVPLAGAIVERRGGMLIHGAIIAREYGLPCVTGLPEATQRIRTGDELTVDGFLGIVTVHARFDS